MTEGSTDMNELNVNELNVNDLNVNDLNVNDLTATWEWLDDEGWKQYDSQTNHQIETAYNSGDSSVKLNKGRYFGKYENQIYDIIFDRSQHPTKCVQRNKQTNKYRKIQRNKEKNKGQQSLLSQINKILIGSYGFPQKLIDSAFKIFNKTYDENSNQTKEYIIDSIMNILETHQQDTHHKMQDDEKKDMEYQPQQQQDPYHSQYEVDDWIEILNQKQWIAAKITKTKKIKKHEANHERNKMIHVEYQDTKTGKTMTMKLHGVKDKNIFRVLGSGLVSDNHSFAFEYGANDKKNIAKNAKHPSAYINRPCIKCKGTGIYKRRNNNKARKTYPCKKCNKGIFKAALSMEHDKCNGGGCDKCESGRYPLQDWKCKTCKGSGIFKVYNKQKHNDNDEEKKCSHCVAGYFLNKVTQFTPTRDANMAHGNDENSKNENVIRLYHATDKEGANGIKELGVMFRGKSGSYGAAIYFAASPQIAKERARQSGYVVIANVYVGKSKDEDSADPEMDFQTLNKMGYDSIRGSWSQDGMEYVVYNWDQVWVDVIVPFNKVDFNCSKLKQ